VSERVIRIDAWKGGLSLAKNSNAMIGAVSFVLDLHLGVAVLAWAGEGLGLVVREIFSLEWVGVMLGE
jgi:hypothetical protein